MFGKHSTGWVPDFPDARDYGLQSDNVVKFAKPLVAHIAGKPAKLPPRISLEEFFPPVYSQDPLQSCTAFAAAALMSYFQKRAYGKDLQPSTLFLYKVERDLLRA